jgi:putative transposase
MRRIRRSIAKRDGVIQSVTVSRGASRWYASVLVKETFTPPKPTRRQLEAGRVGVDVGVKHAFVVAGPSTTAGGLIVDRPARCGSEKALNDARKTLRETAPRSKARMKARITVSRLEDREQWAIEQAGRAVSRKKLRSKNWYKAVARLAELKHRQAVRRKTFIHEATKRLATGYAEIVIEDLQVKGMSASAKGSAEAPGRRVRQKAGLNRRILASSFGEFRRQLEYKQQWYGSHVLTADRWYASSKICAHCGATKAKLPLSARQYVCDSCGYTADRDVNAARNLARCAKVASTRKGVASEVGETVNDRRGRYGRRRSTVSADAAAVPAGRPAIDAGHRGGSDSATYPL